MSSHSVLILDDEALIAFDLAEAVEETGRRTIGPVTSISEAVSITQSEVPDIALLDVNVRNETSWDFARNLLSRGCRIVFFSADAQPVDFDSTFKGCLFLRKPATRDDIYEALDQITQ